MWLSVELFFEGLILELLLYYAENILKQMHV